VNLHEQLDDLFEAISPPPAPIEETMKRGTRIRWRRRVVTVTGVAAVMVAAIGVPLTVHWQASPAPAITRYSVTVQPPSPNAPANEIAYGTVNGKAWRILMRKGTPNASSYGPCAQALGPAVGNEAVYTGPCEPPTGATPADPVVFNGQLESGGGNTAPQAFGYAGAVAANVSYVTIALTSGTVLTLHPVKAYGSRYVAFAAPPEAVTQVTAYSRQGEIASAIAFTGAGQDIFFDGAWVRPGQRGLPRATALLGSGTIDGTAWSATAYQGPWGICTVGSGEIIACEPTPRGMGTMVYGMRQPGGPPALAIWTVPSSTARVVVTVQGEKAFQVRPVTIGMQKFVVFVADGTSLSEPSVTAYDSSGHVVGGL
jgi:hypothetical protein